MKKLFVLWMATAAAAGPAAARADTWQGARLHPQPRAETFEFARGVTFAPARDAAGRPIKDRYEISFEAKAACDAAVVIEDASGRIVRHLVYGVLGANAPAPLATDKLAQTIVWDGKDDLERYVSDPSSCRARVSLGLNPTFDRVLGWHPKDINLSREYNGLAVDADGVYVLTGDKGGRTQLRLFSHDGAYVRTLVPWAADKFATDAVNVTKRLIEDGRTVPFLSYYGGQEPTSGVSDVGALAVGGGRIAMFDVGTGKGGRRLLYLRTDGTTGGEPIVGPNLSSGYRAVMGPMAVALSPDGQYVYLTGINCGSRGPGGNGTTDRPPYLFNSVWKFPLRAAGPVTEKMDTFVGEIGRGRSSGAGDDKAHLNRPHSLCLDAAGDVYVADTGNNRIQKFDASGKWLATIAFPGPAPFHKDQRSASGPVLVRMDRKTGRLYVVSTASAFPWTAQDVTVTRIEPDGKGHAVVFEDMRVPTAAVLMAVDDYVSPPRVWLVTRPGRLRVYADRGEKLELLDDFEADVRRAGFRPHVFGNHRLNRLAVDRVTGRLYYLVNTGAALYRCDPAGPGKFDRVLFPDAGFEEMAFDRDGRIYLKALQYLVRFDPARLRVLTGIDQEPDKGFEFVGGAEIPFDYGEPAKVTYRSFDGGLTMPSMPGANGYDNGFCVGPRGDIFSFVKNYQSKEGHTAGRAYESWYTGAWSFNERFAGRFRPRVFPGRYWNAGELIFHWDARGEPVGRDVLPSLPMASAGLGTDLRANIYVGVGAHQVTDKGLHLGGAVAKFPPIGGRFFGEGDLVKLDKLPDRRPDFAYSDSTKLWAQGGRPFWVQNMFWSYPGLDQLYLSVIGSYPCLCSTCRFATDDFGRSFVPKGYQYTVGVVDTNGNPICDVGRYGNVDSGRGPDSPVKIGGPEIAVAHCSFVATDDDKWLYLNDDGNNRIVRVKLGYHSEQRAALAGK